MKETQRLILRKVTMKDADDIFEYACDEETGPRAGWPPHKTIDDTKEILTKWLEYDNHEQNYAIVLKETNKVIGTIGYTNLVKKLENERNYIARELINKGNTVFEIGITVGKKYWGKGIGTESLKAMIDYLFETLSADVVLTLHFEQNVASEKIQEKNNLKILGQFERQDKWFNTDCTTMIVRGKTKFEWLKENQ